MEKEEISRWATSQAVREQDCPRCGVKKGERCRLPSGWLYNRLHTERALAYEKSIGREEFDRRHKVKGKGVHWPGLIGRV